MERRLKWKRIRKNGEKKDKVKRLNKKVDK